MDDRFNNTTIAPTDTRRSGATTHVAHMEGTEYTTFTMYSCLKGLVAHLAATKTLHQAPESAASPAAPSAGAQSPS